MMSILRSLGVAAFALLSVTSSSFAATYSCDLARGQTPPPNRTGDGEVVNIIVRTTPRGGAREIRAVYATESDPSGMWRDCSAVGANADAKVDVYACSNEFEFGSFDLTSALRMKAGTLARAPEEFTLEYAAVRADRRTRAGFRVLQETVRRYRCLQVSAR